MTILYYYLSTEEDPQHQYCIEGEISQSKFQVDECKWGQTFRPVKDPILNAMKEVILPVLEKLGNQKFLECCKNNKSSKPNEDYHHVLWVLAPKYYFVQHKSFNWQFILRFTYSIVEFHGCIRNHLISVALRCVQDFFVSCKIVPRAARITIYKAFIRPHFDFGKRLYD